MRYCFTPHFYVDAVCGFVLLAHSVPYAQLSFMDRTTGLYGIIPEILTKEQYISTAFFAKLFLINLICVII